MGTRYYYKEQELYTVNHPTNLSNPDRTGDVYESPNKFRIEVIGYAGDRQWWCHDGVGYCKLNTVDIRAYERSLG